MASPTSISRAGYKIWRPSTPLELGIRMSDIKASAVDSVGGMILAGSPATSTTVGAIYYSTDGKTFSASSSAASIFASAVVGLAACNGTYFLALNLSSGASGRIARASVSDPSTWTQLTPTGYTFSNAASMLVAIDGTFILGDSSGNLFTSTNGTTWTAGATVTATSIAQSNFKVISYYSPQLSAYVLASSSSASAAKIWSSTTTAFSSVTSIAGINEAFYDLTYLQSINALVGAQGNSGTKVVNPLMGFVNLTRDASLIYKGVTTNSQIIPPQLATSGFTGYGLVASTQSNWIYDDPATGYVSMYIGDEQSGPKIFSWSMKNHSAPTYTQPAGFMNTATVNAAPSLATSAFTAFTASNIQTRQTMDFNGRTIKIGYINQGEFAILIGEYA